MPSSEAPASVFKVAVRAHRHQRRVGLGVDIDIALDMLVVTADSPADTLAREDVFAALAADAMVCRPESVIDFDGLPVDIAHFDRLQSWR